MRYLLIASLMMLGLLLCRGYNRYLALREAEVLGYLSLLRHVRGRISGLLLSAKDAAKSFSCKALEENGFLPRLREGESLSAAFTPAESTQRLPQGAAEALRDYFSRSGRGGLDSELASIDLCIKELEAVCETEKGERKNRARVAGALIFAITVGGAILLL